MSNRSSRVPETLANRWIQGNTRVGMITVTASEISACFSSQGDLNFVL